MLKGKKIDVHFKNKKILNDVTFELHPGRITTFMGYSGAGKTTLLKCMAGLINFEGEILLHNKALKSFGAKERASNVGFVLQQFHLFPHLSVLKNCTLALTEVFKVEKVEAEELSIEILKKLGIASFANSMPAHLSGGQQQRAAIGRALVLNPGVLLLDEPTSALDPISKKELEKLLFKLIEQGIAIGLSSHDMPFVKQIKDFIYFMEDGKIVEEGESKIKIEGFLI